MQKYQTNKMPPGVHWMFILSVFITSFGETLKVLLSFSPAKLIIPFLFIYIITIRFQHYKLHPLTGIFFGFIVFTVPSLITGVNYSPILFNLIGYLMLFQIIINYDVNLNKIRDILSVYVYGVFFVALITLQFFITGKDFGEDFGKPFIEFHLGFPIVSGPSNNPNGFAGLLLPAIPLAIYLFSETKSILKRFMILLIIITIATTLLTTFSRSAIAAVLLSGVVLHHCRRNSQIINFWLYFKVAVLLFMMIFFGTFINLLIDFLTTDVNNIGNDTVTYSDNKNTSAGYRTMVIIPMLEIFLENIWFGVGWGNIKPIMELKTGLYINSHNTPFGIAMDYGIFALFFAGLTVFLSVKCYLSAFKRMDDPKYKFMTASLLTSLLGLLFHGLFHELYINFMLWVFIGLGPVIKDGFNSSLFFYKGPGLEDFKVSRRKNN